VEYGVLERTQYSTRPARFETKGRCSTCGLAIDAGSMSQLVTEGN
jgi:hypothetical protein